MKKIEDYLHLYLGCEVKSLDGGEGLRYTLSGIDREGMPMFKTTLSGFAMHLSKWIFILRPLSDMTDEEKKECGKISMIGNSQYEKTRYLLSINIDLFGLIEAGLAIDKTTLKK